jgi:hypothetical protein
MRGRKHAGRLPAHLLQNIPEFFDLFAIECPVAVSLGLEGALVMRPRLRGK